jgi:nucleotide-binding universal stress UspA family protein
MAQVHDARLLVLHVLELWDSHYDFMAKDLGRKLDQEARERVAAEVERLGKRQAAPVEVIIARGPTIEQIVETAAKRKAGLVVLGAMSAGHLGCVAEEVVRLCPVSVLVVRRTPVPNFQRICCGLSASPLAYNALEWALDLAARFRRPRLDVVRAFETPTMLVAGFSAQAAREKTLQIQRQEAGKLLEPYRDRPVEMRLLLEEGPPAKSIVKAAEREQAALVVIGTHGQSALASFFLGSVALQVVRAAQVSVLMVKSEEHRKGLLSILSGL